MKMRLPSTIDSTIVSVLLLLFCAFQAWAFEHGLKIDWVASALTPDVFVFHAPDRPSRYDPKLAIHQAITRKGLALTAGHNTLVSSFSAVAVNEIAWANVKTDGDEYKNQGAHFDSEAFYDASQRLVAFKEEVIKAMLDHNSRDARSYLGRALHGLQDFYSHSNFSELAGGNRNGEINPDLGVSVYSLGISRDQSRLKTSFRYDCGKPGWSYCVDQTRLGRDGLDTLTTGWFATKSYLSCEWGVHRSKVIHGGAGTSCNGLNKDSPDKPNHEDAKLSAVIATKVYVTQILDDLRVKDDYLALKTLMDSTPGFAVVVDTSFRMASILGPTKTFIHRLVGNTDPLQQPHFYLLTEFHHDVFPYGIESRLSFLETVDNLSYAPDGVCETFGYKALLDVLSRTPGDSPLYYFSKSSSTPADARLAPAVTTLANHRQVRIKKWEFGNCTFPVNPRHWTDQNGGTILPLDSATLTNMTGMVNFARRTVSLLSASGLLTSTPSKEFTIPIDSTVSNLSFFVSGENTNMISFLNPLGQTLTNGAPGVTITDFSSARIATVAQPDPGAWIVRYEGSGYFEVSVEALTPLELNRFDFVEPRGRPEHLIYIPIPGLPVGTTNTARAYLNGDYTNVSFNLVTPDGEFIQSLVMWEGGTNTAGEFVGTNNILPSQSFKVVVTGFDSNGYPFQRAFPPIFQIAPIEVLSLQTNRVLLNPGVPYHVRYLISNFGAAGDFDVSLISGSGLVSNMTPATITLDAGGTNIVEADIIMFADAPTNTLEFITVAVSRVDDPTIYNGTVDEAEVVAPSEYTRTIMSFNPAGYWPLNEMVAPASSHYVATNLGLAGTAGDGNYMTWWQIIGGGDPDSIQFSSIQHTSGAIGDGNDAAVFGSSGQYVVFQRHKNGFRNDDITIQPPFSMEVWAFAFNTNAGVRGVVSEGRAATQGGTNDNYANVAAGVFLGQNGANYIFDVYYTNGLAAHTPELRVPVEASTWQHLVATFDGTNANFYNNGSLVQMADYSGQTNGAGEVFVSDLISPLLIGCGPNLNGGRFQGHLDEVALYASALSAEEVLAHYDAGTNAAPATPYRDLILNTNPVIYVRLDEPAWDGGGTSLMNLSLPVARNYGAAGPAANGVYQPNTTPGVGGPPYPGFGSANYGVAINGFNAAVVVGGGNLTNTVFDPHGTNAEYTVMTWFKPNPADAQARLQTLMGHSAASWRLDYDNNGLNRFNPGAGPELRFDNNQHGATNGFQLNDGQWHFVAGVCDGTHAYLYLDGRLALTSATTVGDIVGTAHDIILGGDPQFTTPGTRYFDGVIAQAAFFTNALTAANIQQIYNAAVTMPATASANVRITTAVWLATDPARFVLGGTGGIPYGTFYVLTSTNLATPLPNWTTADTNFFDGSGSFSVTNVIQPGEPARFFLLKGQ